MNVAPSSDGQGAPDCALDLGSGRLAPTRADMVVGAEQVDAAGAQVVALRQGAVLVDEVGTFRGGADPDAQDFYRRLQGVEVVDPMRRCIARRARGDERGEAAAEFAQQPAGAAVGPR